MRSRGWMLAVSLLAVTACGQSSDRVATSTSNDALSDQSSESLDAGPEASPCAPDAVPRSSIVVFDSDGRERWSADLRNAGSSSQTGPVVGDGLVFTTEGGELRAFDPSSGDERWRQDVAGPVYNAWAVGGLLVAVVDQVSEQGRIIGFDAQSGAERWVYEVPGRGLLGSQEITSDNGLAIIHASDGELVVIDLSTGRARWAADGVTEQAGFAAGRGVVVRSEGSALTAYDSKDGSVRWSVEAGGDLLPHIVGDLVISSSGIVPNPAPFAAYRVTDGTVAWVAPVDHDFGTAYVTSAGVLVDEGIQTPLPVLLLLDLETGAERWSVAADRYLVAEPLVVDDRLITLESTPGAAGPNEVVVRRLDDGAIERTIPGVAASDGAVDERTAYLIGPDGLGGAVTAVRGVEVVWKASVDQFVQRSPAPLPDGGVAVQAADPMCATPVAGGGASPAPAARHPVDTCPRGEEHCIYDE